MVLGDDMELKNIEDLKKIMAKEECGFLILVGGVEKTLIPEAVSTICSGIEVLPELNIITLTGDSINYDEIVNACESLPIISSRRVVHIKNIPGLGKSVDKDEADDKSKSESVVWLPYLLSYAKAVPKDTILLISSQQELDGKNKLVAEAKSSGYLLEFKTRKGEELTHSISQLFEERGKKISRADLMYLISCTGGTFEAIEREVEKLCSFAINEDTIIKSQIDEVVHKSMENNIFKMVDSISQRNADHAISILNALLFQKEEPLRILGMIIRQFRILYLIYLMENERMGLEEIKASLRKNKIQLMDFVLNNYIRQLKAMDGNSLKKSLEYCAEADRKLKSSSAGNELILETLIVKLCK